MLYFCRRGRQKPQLKKSIQEDWFFIQRRDSTGVQSNRWINKKPPGRWRKFWWRFDDWKARSKLSCGFLQAVSKSPKSLKQVLISAPQENRLHFWWQHEDVWYDMVVVERTLGEKMKNISREAKLSKCYTNHSIRATDQCHNPWQVRFWSKAYYGLKRT